MPWVEVTLHNQSDGLGTVKSPASAALWTSRVGGGPSGGGWQRSCSGSPAGASVPGVCVIAQQGWPLAVWGGRTVQSTWKPRLYSVDMGEL